ncbi:MAG: minor capsid protein, partial [Thermoguttaceae bacterium]|nr:minor capsid protein [Thermoguttaceae bacterium]
LIIATSTAVARTASKQTVKELALARRGAREARMSKTLSQKDLDLIVENEGVNGKTLEETFWRWQRSDLDRLAGYARRASVESLTVDDTAKEARGAIDAYADGIFTTPKIDAVRMARTIINGVSNNTRMETMRANSDVIDGVKFIGTLDGKTCPHCASYDGQIWKGDDMANARRPPIHPNCRCTLVPYVELTDEDGNPVELQAERPAANADFDKLAKDAYNAQAKQKGWKRRWDDLSASTRLKYYYQAQKDYETRTGKPAYRQVPGSTSFMDYFLKQPESFKKSWLGAARYEIVWKNDKLTDKEKAERILTPDAGYTVNLKALEDWQDGWKDELDKDVLKEAERAAEKAANRKGMNDPEYAPVPAEFHGTTLETIDDWIETYRDATEKELLKLRGELDAAEKEKTEQIKAREPQKDAYEDKRMNFNRAKNAWKTNGKDVDKFYDKARGAIDKLHQEKSKDDPQYERKPVEISSPYGTFTPDNLTQLSTLLAQYNSDDFDDLAAIIPDMRERWFDKRLGEAPKRESYWAEASYKKATDEYDANKADGEAFFQDFKSMLAAERKRRSDSDPVYMPEPIEWVTPYGTWRA